ncbi:MAG: type IV-A pilus assembly ATPase PilB [Acidobacteria bacterium]|nr:MAG: type IV-A pilus assembly ATPase PilB [Acidobacteriota bacterium]PYS10394.1 MAG: type IV-A pilus assembly ATPase PilB [Acidobacteriota bacterium]
MSRLGDLLVAGGVITPQQLEEALTYQRSKGGRLGICLIRLGYLTEDVLHSVLTRQFGVALMDLSESAIDPEVVKLLPRELAVRYQVVPVRRTGNVLSVALNDPNDVVLLDELRFRTGCKIIEPLLARESQIREAIDKYYGTPKELELQNLLEDMPQNAESDPESLQIVAEEEMNLDAEALKEQSEEAPIIRLVNFILVDSLRSGASDIHIEPFERELRVRFRTDGILKTVMSPAVKLKDAMTSRIKIMARMNISEKRLPQDGRIRIRTRLEGKIKEIDFRVSVLPTLFGEKIVLRLLDKQNLMFDMMRLGFEPESLKKFERAIHKPFGMVLVTGPTGSGKTNTLYSAITQLNKPETNIMTAEDPVEFNLPGINQVQIFDQVGLTFAATLRSFLRQDPNIILVGEIRDLETAEIAIKASLTGHLVLSTLHTNDAPGTISRLLNMGIEPFLVATSVQLICAQRLVRRICKNCKQEVELPPHAVLAELGFEPQEIDTLRVFRGAGCKICNGTGYKGRVGLYEVMEITSEIKEAIIRNATSVELRRVAVENGMITLRRSGLQKVRDEMTTIEEVVRETVH